MNTVGMIGLGRMGHAMAEKLIRAGHALTVWNRTPDKAHDLGGTVVAGSPADVVPAAPVVLSMLADDTAIDAAYRGPGGLLSADLSGVVIVEMSTTLPRTVERLEYEVSERGGSFLECPVGGTVGPAREGQLLGLAGGSDAAFAAARPVLEKLCRRLEHLGPVGTGAAMKLAVNLPLMVYWSAIGEAAGLATAAGIDPERAFDILADSSGAIGAAKKRVPALCDLMVTGAVGEPNFTLAGGLKDMMLMETLAAQYDLDAPTIASARNKAEAAAAAGWTQYDVSLYGLHAVGEVG